MRIFGHDYNGVPSFEKKGCALTFLKNDFFSAVLSSILRETISINYFEPLHLCDHIGISFPRRYSREFYFLREVSSWLKGPLPRLPFLRSREQFLPEILLLFREAVLTRRLMRDRCCGIRSTPFQMGEWWQTGREAPLLLFTKGIFLPTIPGAWMGAVPTVQSRSSSTIVLLFPVRAIMREPHLPITRIGDSILLFRILSM